MFEGNLAVDGRSTGNARKYDLPRLQALHREILRLKLAGMKNVEIAKRVNCTEAVVSYTVNSSLGKNQLAMMQEMRDEDAVEFSEKIQEMLPQCLEIYEEILDDRNIDMKLRKATADTIVKDIAGKVAPKRIDQRNLTVHMSHDDLKKLKERGRTAAAEAGYLAIDD